MNLDNHDASTLNIPAQSSSAIKDGLTKAQEKVKPGLLELSALVAILLLAAGLRLTNLDAMGLANHYYAAAVKSMLESWHNFFFVAAEPGGSVSVDKPPVGLWLQTISAKIFGISTIGLLLPQILAGLLSVILIYYLVKRRFGIAAGLLAALVLAVTPVVVATDRNNTMDSTLILTLLLASWAFIKASETTRFKFLVLGAVLVGIAFNIKMLEAYLPLPAFMGMVFLSAREGWLRKVGKLVLAGIIILVVSFSWAVAVDLTPADQRPYVGSSGDNSEISLILGYNGIERLVGMFGGGRGSSGVHPTNPVTNQPSQGIPPPDNGFPTGNIPPARLDNINPGGLPVNAPVRGNVDGIGQAGILRLFVPPLSKEISWLLPIGLFSILLLAVAYHLSWPLGPQHQAILLWGGWLITAGIFFSIAGFFHEYYLSTMAPPLAALVGIGVIETWRLSHKHPWLAGSLIVAVTALTLTLQYLTAQAFVQQMAWLPLVIGLFLIGTLLVLAVNFLPHNTAPRLAQLGFTSLVAASLITPGVWSWLTNLYPSSNQSLPAAYDGSSYGPANSGQIQVDTRLLDYLQANTQGVYYLMAVPSSMQGADYVLVTGRPVLYMGGFMGQDEVLTPTSLANLVMERKLRFIYWTESQYGRGAGLSFGGQSLITNWVSNHCSTVQGFNTVTRNFGAPDGINGGTGNGTLPFGAQPMVLYDCGK